MPLYVDNKELVAANDNVVEAATANAEIKKANANFLSSSTRPPSLRKRKCVQVLQNEMASVEYEADDAILASDDATTCVIAVVVCQATGVASIAHMDEHSAKSDACFKKFMSQHVGGRHCTYDAYLVGGMREDTGVGFRAAANFLSHMSRSPGKFNLKLCCVYGENTCPETSRPLARSFAFDPLTQMTYHVTKVAERPAAAVVPAAAAPGAAARKGKRRSYDDGASGKIVFASSGPADCDGCDGALGADWRGARVPVLEQRLAHFWLSDHGETFTDLINVYDTWDQKFVLTGRIHTVPRWLMLNYSYLLTLSDRQLLEKTSTTPLFEGENFCSDVRLALGFILRQPEVFTLHTRSFTWDPIGSVWMETSLNKKVKRSESVRLGYHEEPKVDIPGSSWSYTSLVELEKDQIAAQAQAGA